MNTSLMKESHRIAGGKTLAEVEKQASAKIIKVWLGAWEKGISPHYRDERCILPDLFICAHPDGSEDLIQIDIETGKETVIKKLAPAGKGRYAHLI